MPSFNITTPDLQFVKRCGLVIRFTHLSSGRHARFVGAITDFKDQFSSQWTEEPVYGRMDPISTFQRTGRKISLSWQILNENALIGIQNMMEIQRLISFLYPNYYNQSNNASTISGGPLLRLKFSNFASTPTGEGLVGYLDGFTFDPDMESGYVLTRRDQMITTVINASVNFTVLHTHKLGWTGAKRRVRNFPYGISSPVDDNQDRQAQEAQDIAAAKAAVAELQEWNRTQLQQQAVRDEIAAAIAGAEAAASAASQQSLADNPAFQRQQRLAEQRDQAARNQEAIERLGGANAPPRFDPSDVAGAAGVLGEMGRHAQLQRDIDGQGAGNEPGTKAPKRRGGSRPRRGAGGRGGARKGSGQPETPAAESPTSGAGGSSDIGGDQLDAYTRGEDQSVEDPIQGPEPPPKTAPRGATPLDETGEAPLENSGTRRGGGVDALRN